jgi:hypothetical protein
VVFTVRMYGTRPLYGLFTIEGVVPVEVLGASVTG